MWTNILIYSDNQMSVIDTTAAQSLIESRGIRFALDSDSFHILERSYCVYTRYEWLGGNHVTIFAIKHMNTHIKQSN